MMTPNSQLLILILLHLVGSLATAHPTGPASEEVARDIADIQVVDAPSPSTTHSGLDGVSGPDVDIPELPASPDDSVGIKKGGGGATGGGSSGGSSSGGGSSGGGSSGGRGGYYGSEGGGWRSDAPGNLNGMGWLLYTMPLPVAYLLV